MLKTISKKRNPLHSRMLGSWRMKRDRSEDSGHPVPTAEGVQVISGVPVGMPVRGAPLEEVDVEAAEDARLTALLLQSEARAARTRPSSPPPKSKTRSMAKAALVAEAKAEAEARAKAAEEEREAEEAARRAAAREAELRLEEMKGTSERYDKERKAEVRRAMSQVNQSEKTDLCFMVDATGSMASAIAGVKTQIEQIARDVQRTNPALKLRVAITGYRDALEAGHGEGTKGKLSTLVNGDNSAFDFTESLEAFVGNVAKISARGGGDVAEDVASGFRDVLGFSWRSPTRVPFSLAYAALPIALMDSRIDSVVGSLR